jgi:hypothetical protein
MAVRPVNSEQGHLAWGRFLTHVVMCLTAFMGLGAEPPTKPLLLHALTPDQASSAGPFAGAIQHLQQSLELRPLPVPLTAEALKSVRLVWLVSSGSTPTLDNAVHDATTVASILLKYVEGGGTLWVMLEGGAEGLGSGPVPNLLFKLGIVPGNQRTGAKQLQLPDRTPWFGGLIWSTGSLSPFDIEESPALRKALLVPNDLAQKPVQAKAPDYAGMAMVLGEYGKGRVAILGTSEWLSRPAWNAVSTTGAKVTDNRVFLERLLKWTLSTGHELP